MPAGATPPSPPKERIGGFIAGLLLGLVVGGTLLTLLSYGGVALLASFLFPKSTGGWLPFFSSIPALALGWWAIVLSRKALNFFSGALVGLAAGMLGGTALCAAITGTL